MTRLAVEIVVILLLMAANGVFALAEMAMVSARKTRLKALAQAGDRKACRALELTESPDRFLPTVQIGITVIGLLAGAFGGITIAEQIAGVVKAVPHLVPYAEGIGVGLVVMGLTILSLIFGELVPKRLALANPERFARELAVPMHWVSLLARPAIRLLSAITNVVVRLLGAAAHQRASVSEDEVTLLVKEGQEAGVFHEAEPRMVESVLALDRLPVRAIMTPREQFVCLNQDDGHEVIWREIVVSGHAHFPVCAGNPGEIVGVVSVKAIYANLAAGAPVALRHLMVVPVRVGAAESVTQLLERFRQSGQHLALVTDGAGGVVGLVSLVDVLQTIVGELPSREERLRPMARRRSEWAGLAG